MPTCPDHASRVATILVQRRLDDVVSGSGVYLFTLVDKLIAAGFDIRIVVAPVSGFGSRPVLRLPRRFAQNGIDVVWPQSVKIGSCFVSVRPEVWRRTVLRGSALAWWWLSRRRRPRPAFENTLGKPLAEHELQPMTAAANAVRSAIVVSEYSALAPALAHCDTDLRAVLLHDVFALRAQSFRESGLRPDHVAVSLETEVGWLADADLCIYASQAEAARLSRALPEEVHIWMPPKVVVRQVPPTGPPRAVFVGVRHGGNLDALDMILTEIWPPVRRALPEAELWIVGEIRDAIGDPPEGVRLLRRVDDLATIGGPDAVGCADPGGKRHQHQDRVLSGSGDERDCLAQGA